MSILDELRAESGTGGPCIFATWLATLTKAVQTELAAAMTDDTISSAAVTRWGKRNGYTGSEGVVRLHRTGTCKCPK